MERLPLAQKVGSTLLQITAIGLSLTLPLLSTRIFLFDQLGGSFWNPYSWLWAGFYGSILMLFAGRRWGKWRPISFLLMALNGLVLMFWLFFSLMGGIQGLIATVLHMLIPIMPETLSCWLRDQILIVFPPEKFPPV